MSLETLSEHGMGGPAQVCVGRVAAAISRNRTLEVKGPTVPELRNERLRPDQDRIGDPERFLKFRLGDASGKSRIAGLNSVDAELIGVLYVRRDLQALAFKPIEQHAEIMDKRKDPSMNLVDRLDRQLRGLLGQKAKVFLESSGG